MVGLLQAISRLCRRDISNKWTLRCLWMNICRTLVQIKACKTLKNTSLTHLSFSLNHVDSLKFVFTRWLRDFLIKTFWNTLILGECQFRPTYNFKEMTKSSVGQLNWVYSRESEYVFISGVDANKRTVTIQFYRWLHQIRSGHNMSCYAYFLSFFIGHILA